MARAPHARPPRARGYAVRGPEARVSNQRPLSVPCCRAAITTSVVGGAAMVSNAAVHTSPRLNVRTALSAAGRAWGDGRWSGLQVQPSGDASSMPSSPREAPHNRGAAVHVMIPPAAGLCNTARAPMRAQPKPAPLSARCCKHAEEPPSLVIRSDAAAAPSQRPPQPRRGKWSL